MELAVGRLEGWAGTARWIRYAAVAANYICPVFFHRIQGNTTKIASYL